MSYNERLQNIENILDSLEDDMRYIKSLLRKLYQNIVFTS